MNYDVLIVGTGIAGLYTALNLRDNIRILMITKNTFRDCNSYLAQGGISTSLGIFDEKSYFNDTMKAGNYHNDTKAVKLLIKNSIENINTLIKLGVPFDKTKEKLNYTREGGHSEFRIVHVKDETGKSVTETLLNIVSKKRNITMPNDYIEKINSMSFEEVAKYTIERFNLNESVDSLIKEWNDMAIYEYSNNIKLKPNVKEYLVKLKKHDIKIGLATSSPKELYEPVLKNNKVYDYFDTFTSVDDVKRDKNYPDIYLYTAKKLGLYPNECIIFEDILIAINTAKESNFKAIGVYDKSSYNDLDKIKVKSDKFIYDFKELL